VSVPSDPVRLRKKAENRGELDSKSTRKPRLDELLCQRGFFDSRARARAAVLAGEVFVSGRLEEKAGVRVAPDADIEVRSRSPKYASRGGLKLEGALSELRVEVAGKTVLDVGASTGGFTDCLLQHGARRVYALDVGYGLLDEKLKGDERVVVMERTNVRHATPGMFDEKPDMAVVDVSFISLKLVLPVLKELGTGEVLALVKPQFEVGKEDADRSRGVIRDPQLRDKAADFVISFAKSLGFIVSGKAESKLHGPKGNIEIFVHLYRQ